MEPLGTGPLLDALAQLTAVLVNLYRERGQKAYTLADFRLRYGREEDQTDYVDPAVRLEWEIEATVRQLLAEHGGYDARTGRSYTAPDGTR